VLASIFDNGAVYYPIIFGVPILAGIVTALRRPDRRGVWIVVGVVAMLMLLDFAFDEERFSDLPFFVVLGIVLSGLGLLARVVAKRLHPSRTVA
jgi:hypothetical protein